MQTVERILDQVKALPSEARLEVLSYVGQLAEKHRPEAQRRSESALKTALSLLDEEDRADYCVKDFKEGWF
jgi:ElaB/YqjD/DUF883 family membrane-anchored ribosome-binding protein